MKKLICIYISVIITAAIFSVNINGNIEYNYNINFNEDIFNFDYTSSVSESVLKFSFGTDYFNSDMTFKNDGNNVYNMYDGEFLIKNTDYRLTGFYNRKMINTNDWLKIINDEKIGAVSGLRTDYDFFGGKMTNFFVKRNNFLTMNYYKMKELFGIYSSFIYLKENNDAEKKYREIAAFDFSAETFRNIKPYGEFALYSYESDYLNRNWNISERLMYLLGIKGNIGKTPYNISLFSKGNDFPVDYSPDVLLSNNIYTEINPGNYTLKNILYTKNGFSPEKIYSEINLKDSYAVSVNIYPGENILYNTDLYFSYKIPYSSATVENIKIGAYKKGIEDDYSDIKKYKPFNIFAEFNFNLFNGDFRYYYKFGNPVNEFFTTLGEQFYAEYKKQIGKVYTLTKVQYYKGALNDNLNFYTEAVIPYGSTNIKLYIGNNNFEILNFTRQIGLTVYTGF